MRRASLYRSTSLRLALAFAALFVIAFVLSGFVAFDLIRNDLKLRYDSHISEMYGVISQAFADTDVQDIIDATKVNIAANRDKQSVFMLQSPDGQVLAANMPPQKLPDGWSTVSGTALGIDVDYDYRLFAGSVGGYRLIVGTSNEQTVDVQKIVLASFGWASLVVVGLAIAGGTLLAARAERRFSAVRRAMDRVAQGELDARIPLLGNDDDLDHLLSDINAALERLSRLVEGMRQVSADIAHDLKTPLNRLSMIIEQAAARHAKGLGLEAELAAAAAESARINETFMALLNIAQIGSGARKSRFTDIDLGEVMENITDIYHDVAEDAGHELVYTSTAAAPARIRGDRELLIQMLANLIENAIRHCPSGTRIACELTADSGSCVVVVGDNGPGVPEAERGNVLRRLYRLEKSRTSPGSGLGLSLVKAIADLHEARLELGDNAPGLSVRVTFRRPAA